MLLLCISFILFVMRVDAFNFGPLEKNVVKSQRKLSIVKFSSSSLKMSLLDQIPLPVLVLCSSALVFGIFNININVDLTDEGIASAKLKKRQERLARGEVLPKKGEDIKDPYRYKWFEEDDEDELLQIVEGRKKSGGGCG